MINWREIPFVRLLMPLILGIVLGTFFNLNWAFIPPMLGLLAFGIVILSTLRQTFSYRWFFGIMLNLFLLLLGYQCVITRNDWHKTAHFRHFISEKNKIIGVVTEVLPREKSNRIILNIQQIGGVGDSILKKSVGKILLYAEKDSLIEYGDLLLIEAKLSEIEPPKNPNAFDFKRYLNIQGIHYQSFKKLENYKKLDSGRGNLLMTLAQHWQKSLVEMLQKYLPTTESFSVGAALLLGYRAEIPDEVLNAYISTGAVHVLSVSGLHVGFVAGVFMFLFGLFKRNTPVWTWIKTILILLGIWIFALITGATPSVLRSAVMFSFVVLGFAMRRDANIYNTIACAAFCLLLWNPMLLFDVGFQLSYLGVVGIIYFQPKIYRLWIPENTLLNYFWQLTSVGIAAQLATTPLSFYYFHQFPTYFWLSGIFVVPLAAVILYLGILLFLCAKIPFLNTLLGYLLYDCIVLINQILFWIEKLPLSVITGVWLGALSAVLLYLALSSFMLSITFKRFKWAILGIFFLTLTTLNYAFTDFQQYQQRQVVIYSLYKNTLLDCVDGKNIFSIASQNMEEKTIRYNAQNYRTKLGAKTIQNFSLNDTTFISSTFFLQHNFVQFYDKKIAFINGNIEQASPNIEVNYLIICGNPKLDMASILSKIKCEKVIFDVSNSHYKVEKWLKICENLGVESVDIGEKGALVIDF